MIAYTHGDDKIILCDTECKNLYWSITLGSDNVANVMMEKSECNRCGRMDFPCVRYNYKIIGIVKPKKNMNNNNNVNKNKNKNKNKKKMIKRTISLPSHGLRCKMCNKKKIRYTDCKIMNMVQCTDCNTINYLKDHQLSDTCSAKCIGSVWDNQRVTDLPKENEEDQTTKFASSFICTNCSHRIDNVLVSMTRCIIEIINDE